MLNTINMKDFKLFENGNFQTVKESKINVLKEEIKKIETYFVDLDKSNKEIKNVIQS